MKFMSKIQRFMNKRYGVDELYNFLFVIYFFLLIVNIFINSNILRYIELVIMIIMLYRFFSKNVYQRKKENAMFLRVKKKVLKPFSNINRNIKDKHHIYKRCQKCRTILKLELPNKRGIKTAICPTCKRKIKFIVLKKQKIEIIK